MFNLIIRTFILYIYLVFIMRLMGKRQLGQLQPVDLVIALMISELATLPMEDNRIPLIYAIVPISTLVLLQIMTSVIELKSEKLRTLLNGEPSILVKDGIVDIKELKHLRYNLDDLLEELRLKGYFNLNEIHYAMMETNGDISIIPKTSSSPPNREDINLDVQDEPLPIPVILDGNINYRNLRLMNKDIIWLQKKLKENNVEDPTDIFVAILYSKSEKIFLQYKDTSLKMNK
ncbi:DUF421 domain-containing protein [Clostridium sp.]|uniref:DUF421 domain-containing protein n=1 Tax=Clostridium sp. TaxID=1506 RepID=UPI002FC84159